MEKSLQIPIPDSFEQFHAPIFATSYHESWLHHVWKKGVGEKAYMVTINRGLKGQKVL